MHAGGASSCEDRVRMQKLTLLIFPSRDFVKQVYVHTKYTHTIHIARPCNIHGNRKPKKL